MMLNLRRRDLFRPSGAEEWVRAYWRTVLLACVLVALAALAGVILGRIWGQL